MQYIIIEPHTQRVHVLTYSIRSTQEAIRSAWKRGERLCVIQAPYLSDVPAVGYCALSMPDGVRWLLPAPKGSKMATLR